MIQSTHKNFVSSPVFTTNSVLMTPGGTQSAVGAAALLPAPVQLQTEAVALQSGPRVSLSAAGEGAYGGAVWPIVGGSGNTMSYTNNLAGPGAALASFTLATTAQIFYLSSPSIDAAGNVFIINRVGSSVVLRKYATTSVPFVELWSYTTTTIAFTEEEYGYFCPTLGQGVVYFMTTNGLHCVDSNTGVLKWVNPLRSFNYNFRAFLMLDKDGNVYGAVRELVFSVAPSGVTRWMTTVTQYVASMALDAATGILYAWCFGIDSFGNVNSCALRLFDHATGTELVTTPNTIACGGGVLNMLNINFPVMIGNHFVYVSTGREVVAFHKHGDVAWIVPSYEIVYGPVAYNPKLDRVYFSGATNVSAGGTRYALQAVDGATGILVNATLPGGLLIFPTMCIIDENDHLYARLSDNTIRVFDAALNQVASVPNPKPGSVALALDTNGKLYVCADAGLYVSN